ncbi:hypothetical protein HDE_12581 [Halotydeus destructor]|nr:hypothetical protein HDE_12581 [Halotydeus destructor]
MTQFMNRTSLRVRYDEVMCYTISFTRYFDSNYTQKFLRLSNPIPIALSIIISPKFERYVANMSTYMGDQGVRSSGVSGMFQGIEPRVAKLHSYGRQKIELLPPPYVTKCYDHSQNGHSSRDLCYKRCKLQFYLKRYNQIPCKVPYDLVDDIAYYDINGSRDDQPIGECLDKCSQIHCNLINYEHTLMFKKNIGGRTSVDLALNGDAEILVIYKPYVTFMEFFAMVGSVLGVWLGLSSLSFVHIGHLFGRKSPKSLPAAGHYVKMAARSKQPSSKLFTRQAMS